MRRIVASLLVGLLAGIAIGALSFKAVDSKGQSGQSSESAGIGGDWTGVETEPPLQSDADRVAVMLDAKPGESFLSSIRPPKDAKTRSHYVDLRLADLLEAQGIAAAQKGSTEFGTTYAFRDGSSLLLVTAPARAGTAAPGDAPHLVGLAVSRP